MIDFEKLKPVLEGYKAYFPLHWENERYKWIAVQHFQKYWDIDAEDFGAMFKRATEKTSNLLTSGYVYPRGMILDFANADEDATRNMFRNLFDETIDLATRVTAFRNKAEELRATYDNGHWFNHYQNTNAISTYLWLRYPDKYYIYKYELYRVAARELASDYSPKRNGSVDNLIGGFQMYDEICKAISEDASLRQMIQASLTPACYPDPEFKTATIDVGFYLARFYVESKKKEETESQDEMAEPDMGSFSDDWYPTLAEYSPGFTKEQWLELLNSKKIIGPVWGGALAAFYGAGSAATCTQIAQKYNKSASSISGNCTQLAKRIYKVTNCPLSIRENGEKRYWPILFQGKSAGEDIPGGYIWKLRPELYEALTEFDIMRYEWTTENNPLEQVGDANGDIHYWWLTANPRIWSFSDIRVGEEQSYTLYNENGNKRRIFQNFLDAKAGDVVIGYEATPVKKIVALGRITQANDGNALYFEKTESLFSPVEYQSLKDAPELENMEFFVQSNGSLFKLTPDEYAFIMDMIREDNPLQLPEVEFPKYTKADFLNKVFMTEARYDVLEALLRYKKNVILQGAPGVGKTFTAKRLAYAMMGEEDDSRIEMVQFHQNYSYEDFIMGYRPVEERFVLTEGIFYRFCQKAANHPDKEYFFIIDEINRGNLSKIFGELLMLIEKDYRGTKATLAYSGNAFSVPENLYIIGMMNTADRSLAMIDYALRRRFSFFEMEPGFSSDGFMNYQQELASETLDTLIEQIKRLNKDISDDSSLGRGFQIGHSYFCGREETGCSDDWLQSVVEFEILPMLSEYWFDDPAKLHRWEQNLRGVFDD